MQVEVTAAINLIAASLYNKLPRRRVDAFAEEIEKGIAEKFHGHWYPDNPSKGAAYRCINVSGEKVDPVIIYAIINSGLDVEEVSNYLPKDLTVWIDPGEVSFSIGEKGQVRLLYSERRPTNETSAAAAEDTTTNQRSIQFTSCPATSADSSVMSTPLGSPDELTSNLSSSFGSLSLSSGGSNGCTTTSWGATPSPIPWPTSTSSASNPWSAVPPQKPASFSTWSNGTNYNTISTQPAFPIGTPAPSLNRPTPNSNKTMTAAMFAQTKFGSTKLKTHTKRSNRLSPTENFSRAMNGTNAYGQMRQNPTLSSAFYDRMQLHMNPQNNNDFLIDHFTMNSNSVRSSSDRFNMMANTKTDNTNGSMARYSPCTVGSWAGVLSTDQDWVDLTDMAVHPSGNQLLAA